jgi:hypothetical protein
MKATTSYHVACDEIKNPHRYQPIAKGPFVALCIALMLAPIAFVWILGARFWYKKRV